MRGRNDWQNAEERQAENRQMEEQQTEQSLVKRQKLQFHEHLFITVTHDLTNEIISLSTETTLM